MKKEQADISDDLKGVRKSKRQRVPNQFYTEGINELKKTNLKSRKKSRIYDSEDGTPFSDKNQNVEKEPIAVSKPLGNDWFDCQLPDHSNIKVQFVVTPQEMDRKKEEVAKAPKKQDNSFDLLTLFQQAIQVVNDSNVEPEESKPGLNREDKSLSRRINDDREGRIVGVQVQDGILKLNHSKLGNCQMEIQWDPPHKIDCEQEEGKVQEFRERIKDSNMLSSLPILN